MLDGRLEIRAKMPDGRRPTLLTIPIPERLAVWIRGLQQ